MMARARARVTQPGAVLALVILVVASYAYRLPPLLNARSTNSDAAVVGLQAMHMLRGELSPFLWGSGYQTSADSAVAALFFAALGASPYALMLSALSLHVIATLLVYAVVRRRFEPWLALLITSPLVLSPSSVHSYALYPPRQASLTLALAAFWAIDGARARPGRDEHPSSSALASRRWLAPGGALATLAISADPYPLLLMPLVVLYAVLAARDAGPTQGAAAATRGRGSTRFAVVRQLASFGAGASLGIVPFVVLHRLPQAKGGPMTFTTTMLDHHLRLLVEECLPWALSYKVYYAHHVMDYRPWDAPGWFRVLGVSGAVLLAALVGVALLGAFGRWPRRRRDREDMPGYVWQLGLIGALTFPLALGAFLVSVMVMDHFSMRYLAVLTLMTPFAVLPGAYLLGPRRFPFAFAPHVLASAVAGWVGYGPFVDGARPVAETRELRDDDVLRDVLRSRGVRWATADYWVAYRLTFLFAEEPVVVPLAIAEDRYPPYRAGFDGARNVAYIFDPWRSREDRETTTRALRASSARVEEVEAGSLHVVIVTRDQPLTPSGHGDEVGR